MLWEQNWTIAHKGSRNRTVNSIVLLSNGISFVIQIFIFLILGSLAGEPFFIRPKRTIMSPKAVARFRTMEAKHLDRSVSRRSRNRLWVAWDSYARQVDGWNGNVHRWA